MRNFGPFIIMHKQQYPAFLKAHRLARTLTEIAIDDILEHRCHLHRNPTRKLRVIAADKCQISTSEIIDPTEKAWTK